MSVLLAAKKHAGGEINGDLLVSGLLAAEYEMIETFKVASSEEEVPGLWTGTRM